MYAKIYRKSDVTNNELIKGYIAEQMEFDVDSTIVAALMALTLASRLEGELLKRDLLPEEAAQLQLLAPHTVSKPFGSQSKANGAQSKTTGLSIAPSVLGLSVPRSQYLGYSCDVGVLATKIANTEEVLRLEVELLSNIERREHFL